MDVVGEYLMADAVMSPIPSAARCSKAFDTTSMRGMKPVNTAHRIGALGARSLLAPRASFFPAGPGEPGLRAAAGGGNGRNSPAPISGEAYFMGAPFLAAAGGGVARNSPALISISAPLSSRCRDHAAELGPQMLRRVQIHRARGQARSSWLSLRARFASPAFSEISGREVSA